MTTEEVVVALDEKFNAFKAETAKTTKKSKAVARKLSMDLRNLLVSYKKATLAEGKA